METVLDAHFPEPLNDKQNGRNKVKVEVKYHPTEHEPKEGPFQNGN